MKFIRDIISEKRNVKSAGLPLLSPLPTSTYSPLENPDLSERVNETLDAKPQTLNFSEHQTEMAGPGGIARHADANGGTDRFCDNEMNLFAHDDAALDEDINQRPRREDWSQTEFQDQTEIHSAAAEALRQGDASSPDPDRFSPNGQLHLDVGSARGLKQTTLFDRLKETEVQRNETSLKPASGQHLRPVTDELRLRLAMKDDDDIAAHRSTLIASAPVAEATIRRAETATNDRGLGEMPFVSVLQSGARDDIAPDSEMQVPPPAAGRGANRSGRVKTRLLGFNPEGQGLSNPFEKDTSRANETFPVGWLVVVAGPGRGAAFPLHDGVARIGRGDDQTVCLNFGDNSISRENHVSVAFDSEQNAFFIGQSGRSNIVRLNNKPLLSTEQVRTGDQIRVGETTLRLVALCGEGFSWAINH